MLKCDEGTAESVLGSTFDFCRLRDSATVCPIVTQDKAELAGTLQALTSVSNRVDDQVQSGQGGRAPVSNKPMLVMRAIERRSIGKGNMRMQGAGASANALRSAINRHRDESGHATSHRGFIPKDGIPSRKQSNRAAENG